MKGECRCPLRNLIGLNLLSEVSISAASIVRLDRINAYNDVNERRGFRRLTIVTPLEVVHGIDEENQEDV